MDDIDFPIELERVMFTRSVVISVQGYQAPEVIALTGPENEINIAQVEEEKNVYMATMTTRMNIDGSVEYPYIIDMECIGIFRVKDEADDEARSGGLVMVAHSVLYGAIREAIYWITGRQAYGQISLGLSVLQPKQKK
ncbi:MAG: protein-export chaperone SecB [Deltaproteobacteria bacterium]|nr:protein-export chaperone SecB [Deltaproteobacteria bacterium]